MKKLIKIALILVGSFMSYDLFSKNIVGGLITNKDGSEVIYIQCSDDSCNQYQSVNIYMDYNNDLVKRISKPFELDEKRRSDLSEKVYDSLAEDVTTATLGRLTVSGRWIYGHASEYLEKHGVYLESTLGFLEFIPVVLLSIPEAVLSSPLIFTHDRVRRYRIRRDISNTIQFLFNKINKDKRILLHNNSLSAFSISLR